MQRSGRVYRPHIWVARVRAPAAIRKEWLKQEGALFLWAPVCLGLGVGLYFAAVREPALWLLWAMGLIALPMVIGGRWLGVYIGPVVVGIGLGLGGYVLAAAEALRHAEPVLTSRYYGPVEGRVILQDRAASGALRLTLDQVRLDRRRAPHRVRVALYDDTSPPPINGDTVILTAHLSPPSGPAEPGGFDFRRHAWYQRLGAVGYSRTPVLLRDPAPKTLTLMRLRQTFVTRIRAALPDQSGDIAAALLAGDRSGVPPDTVRALRDSNLAHLLAISGLHMGLLAGLVYAVARRTLSLVPRIALYHPTKKIAAAVALTCAAAYLGLSGASVATQRAFVMAAVGLCAVMADRRVFSLRSVATAALVLLVLQPHALTGPGFQMSFAATTGLIAGFDLLSPHLARIKRRWLQAIVVTVLSSAMAGAATAPFAAAHFNRLSDYGLIANLLATPLMGTVVMPAGIAGAVLMPFGLEKPALVVMGFGIDWIVGVAETVSAWPSAVTPVHTPNTAAFLLLTGGALFLSIWQGIGRLAGIIAIGAACLLWSQTPRPQGLVSDDGKLVAVLSDTGRVPSHPKGAGFVASVWLENDGDPASQSEAAARAGWRDAQSGQVWHAGAWTIQHIKGKREARTFDGCSGKTWVISDQDLDKTLGTGDCRITTPRDLRKSGALAFRIGGDQLAITSAREHTGQRLWNTRARDTDQ